MKLFLKRLIQFLLPIALIVLLGFFVLRKQTAKSTHYAVPKQKTSIILGHSHAACAYNDSIIGDFYNLAQNAEGYPYSYFKAKKLLENNPYIKRIFIEYSNNQLTPWAVDRVWGRYLKYNMERTLPVLDLRYAAHVFKASSSLSQTSDALFASYRKNIDFLVNGKGNFIEHVWHTNTTTDHIFSGDTTAQKKDLSREFQNIYEVQEENLKYLFNLKKLCEKHKVQLILLRSPAPKHVNSPNETVLKHIKNTFFSNTPFLDFRNYKMDIKKFADHQHLNVYGKDEFSLFFRDSIAANGFTDFDKLHHIIKRHSY